MFGDLATFVVSIYLAIGFKFGFSSVIDHSQRYLAAIALIIGCKSIVFLALGIYKPVLKYLSTEFAPIALKAVGSSAAIVIALNFVFSWINLPVSIVINDAILTLLGLLVTRLAIRSVLSQILYGTPADETVARAAIYGAGSAGTLLSNNLKHENGYQAVCFVDDDPSLHNRLLSGLTIYPPAELERLKERGEIDVILLAIPSISNARRREILESLLSFSIPVKTVPSVSEILAGDTPIERLRDISIEDLLGRSPIEPRSELLSQDITGKVVLVTGAGGSIGSELCRQIAQQQPRELILYELSEFALYQIDLELGEIAPELIKSAYLGSVTDRDRLGEVMRDHRVQTVYHAAAYKHVPLVEANVVAGVVNNIIGTRVAVEVSIAAGVEKFVLISTDKAVRPTNVMGTTKRVTELILQGLATRGGIDTCLTMVRFGNVLGSSGSVIPRFQQQLIKGQPLTVTHKDITRYFMSIPEAAALVIQAGAMAKGGEVFLLDMGEPVRIYDLASQVIRLHGLEPNVDVPIEIVGLRPGEKIYEELLLDMEQALSTSHPKIFCGRETHLPWPILQDYLGRLEMEVAMNRADGCLELLRHLVPEYNPRRNCPSYSIGDNEPTKSVSLDFPTINPQDLSSFKQLTVDS
jgi:FlaA1/EpsC-like NDP-sugar epimerase